MDTQTCIRPEKLTTRSLNGVTAIARGQKDYVKQPLPAELANSIFEAGVKTSLENAKIAKAKIKQLKKEYEKHSNKPELPRKKDFKYY